ncbi:hypothetical protein RhiirA1_482657 [Rhizophagus irregularis]|uniref:Uncharacterized protein n=1 Tax=Rhizophagus irregularis TaxID=588596 RepID=A0A2N0QLJ3_9GLOM|nr:hypothetical protein RhiirA1_482657 [Rhizophagus irregularis]
MLLLLLLEITGLAILHYINLMYRFEERLITYSKSDITIWQELVEVLTLIMIVKKKNG